MPVLDAVLNKTLPFDVRWQLLKKAPRVTLTMEQIDTFWTDGHLTIPDFVTPDQVDEIDRSFGRLFSGRVGWKEGDLFDMAGLEEDGKIKLPQLLHPAKYAPELLRSQFWANAEAVAQTLLGADAKFSFDHAINKPTDPDSATPWHQDQAFHREGSKLENITIWLPLQDVDEENGCLTFIPGSHNGPILHHRNYKDDKRIEFLEAVGVDLDKAVTVPLRRGSVSIHHSRTLHYAGANRSPNPRKVYSVLFAVEKPDPVVAKEYPWNLDKPTNRFKRKQAYEERWVSRAHRKVKQALRNTLHTVVG
ncbi:phytanoyl-CoA dioxygenase family protein [Skermanella stibiiresistens]|uniref:phytanoyl-CoA dioxygenase family protein n=1 Tax=Skermanella stibiiresistens TaxID=913326 RepID=UPI0018DD6F5F|nr:phytanoyl-CoA dioxygenase family protein [Skermanella stibiiresistens]